MRLIDADALIDDCKKYLNELNPSRDGKECTRIHWLIGILSNAPTIEPERKWIPCSERLPKIGKEILLSEPNIVSIAEYHGSGDSEGLWLVDGRHHYLADVNGCAWMPLPKPWKEGEE